MRTIDDVLIDRKAKVNKKRLRLAQWQDIGLVTLRL